jgi:hypothetical protein
MYLPGFQRADNRIPAAVKQSNVNIQIKNVHGRSPVSSSLSYSTSIKCDKPITALNYEYKIICTSG